jgi:hypothetical protein
MKYRIMILPNGKFWVYSKDKYGNIYDSMHSFKKRIDAVKYINLLKK